MVPKEKSAIRVSTPETTGEDFQQHDDSHRKNLQLPSATLEKGRLRKLILKSNFFEAFTCEASWARYKDYKYMTASNSLRSLWNLNVVVMRMSNGTLHRWRSKHILAILLMRLSIEGSARGTVKSNEINQFGFSVKGTLPRHYDRMNEPHWLRWVEFWVVGKIENGFYHWKFARPDDRNQLCKKRTLSSSELNSCTSTPDLPQFRDVFVCLHRIIDINIFFMKTKESII